MDELLYFWARYTYLDEVLHQSAYFRGRELVFAEFVTMGFLGVHEGPYLDLFGGLSLSHTWWQSVFSCS